ncbi:MAG: ComF family protein [Planctomycetota bacterium]
MNSSFISNFTKEIHFFLDYIYPRFCLACGKSLSFSEQFYLCSGCVDSFQTCKKNRCIGCAQPLAYLKKCGKCKGKHISWKQLWCLYEYEKAVVPLVKRWKIHREEEAWRGIKKFFQQGLKDLTCPPVDLVVPVPLHPKKLAERGFNPAEQLARLVSKEFQIPLKTRLLKRLKQTPNQKQLSEKERKHNLSGVFSCKKVPQNVLIVDDIMTTGSTLRELCKVLKQQGAKSIYCLVLARTPKLN